MGGFIINNDFREEILPGNVDLYIVDPPYGGIVEDEYDKVSEQNLVHFLFDMLDWMGSFAYKGTSAYIFGGVGKYMNRPFFKFASTLEHRTKWHIHNVITWAKRRGYGTQRNWMFAREEILFLVYDDKYPKYFNVPYRDEERSEEWKKRLSKVKHKPKTNKLRYSNVIQDINEIFRNQHKDAGCLVTAEKPEALYKLLIETSCPSNGFIVDPMAGSGTTAVVIENNNIDVNYLCIEKDEATFDIIKRRLTKI